eukprot:scaffold44489_cov29-Tisochrysis_lutea.AAC.2
MPPWLEALSGSSKATYPYAQQYEPAFLRATHATYTAHGGTEEGTRAIVRHEGKKTRTVEPTRRGLHKEVHSLTNDKRERPGQDKMELS